ncbi:luciferin sulfotransferase-like [Macrosteles quadrilineatus]|uniref:luciferin sulfotransferase-like n=1 Tax=Macrosteles quadrilineatus TaxID=74068 RepID=UPI0023E0987C|nr:luciferin sulfotransferase-like [Macrosteles quadrilineatus]
MLRLKAMQQWKLISAVFLIICIVDIGATLKHEPLTDETSQYMKDQCKGAMPAGEVRLEGTVTTKAYAHRAQEVIDMEVREDDIWIISFPKTGTTWTQEMVWLLKNNLDYEKARKMIYERYLFLEYRLLWGDKPEDSYEVIPDMIQEVKDAHPPRYIMTHLPKHLLPKDILTVKPKIIYVTRNPKDVAISYFYHFMAWNNYKGTMDHFLKAFVEDKVVYSPYYDHVLTYKKLSEENDNILFITFEDMKKDLSKVVKKTAEFLKVTYSDEELKALIEHLSFSKMKQNPAVNYHQDYIELEKKYGVKKMANGEPLSYIRNGEDGEWERVMTREQIKMFDDWTKKTMEDKGINFSERLN